MKKQLSLNLLFMLVAFTAIAQTLNQSANWPNANWSLTGSYDNDHLDANPTLDASFSFDDDAAGSSSINLVAAESPVIDLTASSNAGETDIVVSFDFVYRIYEDETLNLQYWDDDNSTWVTFGDDLMQNSGLSNNFCNGNFVPFSSEGLNITAFSANQLQNFRYRIFYDDNTSWGYGFCINSPTITSQLPPLCPNINGLTLDNVGATSVDISWTAGGTETTWEVAIVPAGDPTPSSGTLVTTIPYTFTGLNQLTDYIVYVRADCGADGVSTWSNASFTTGFDDSNYPVTFNQNPISTSGSDRALVDMNGDFLDDVVAVSSNNINIHYQNTSGGFTETNISTTQADNLPSWSLAAGDIDGNGFNDLLYGGGSGVTFMLANSDGTAYSEISGPEFVFSQRSNFIDIDNDGNLDAFVCHDIDPNVYYINDGSGNLTFYQGQSAALPNGIGLTPGGGNYGTVWIDYDNDRDMDMFIAKCRGGNTVVNINELWRNDGNGEFVNVADISGWYNTNYPGIGHDNSSNLGDAIQTWSSAWADFDNDGDMDVYVGASSSSNGLSKLMQNNGDGTFTDVTSGSGVSSANLGIENAPADFDNDGFVDILSNGNILFNNGDFTFTNFSANIPNSGAIGDINNDGFLDVFSNGTIYTNNSNANNWLKIITVGTESNLNGIGARVEITTPSGTQIRDVRSGEGFRYMSSLNTHFGLGTDTTITNITVYWPSGIIDNVSNPSINSTLTIVEGETLSIPDESLADLSIYPNPVKDMLYIKTKGNVVDKVASVFDINGKLIFSHKLTNEALDVSKLNSGIYFLRLESQGKTMRKKFIKL